MWFKIFIFYFLDEAVHHFTCNTYYAEWSTASQIPTPSFVTYALSICRWMPTGPLLIFNFSIRSEMSSLGQCKGCCCATPRQGKLSPLLRIFRFAPLISLVQTKCQVPAPFPSFHSRSINMIDKMCRTVVPGACHCY